MSEQPYSSLGKVCSCLQFFVQDEDLGHFPVHFSVSLIVFTQLMFRQSWLVEEAMNLKENKKSYVGRSEGGKRKKWCNCVIISKNKRIVKK